MTTERGRTHHLVRTYRQPRGLRAAVLVLAGLLLLVAFVQLFTVLGIGG